MNGRRLSFEFGLDRLWTDLNFDAHARIIYVHRFQSSTRSDDVSPVYVHAMSGTFPPRL